MTAPLLAELEAVGGRVSLRGERLTIAAPPALIARLPAAKPAIVVHLRERCERCGEAEGAPGALLPIGEADAGHWWVHDGCYSTWLADRRHGLAGPRAA